MIDLGDFEFNINLLHNSLKIPREKDVQNIFEQTN